MKSISILPVLLIFFIFCSYQETVIATPPEPDNRGFENFDDFVSYLSKNVNTFDPDERGLFVNDKTCYNVALNDDWKLFRIETYTDFILFTFYQGESPYPNEEIGYLLSVQYSTASDSKPSYDTLDAEQDFKIEVYGTAKELENQPDKIKEIYKKMTIEKISFDVNVS